MIYDIYGDGTCGWGKWIIGVKLGVQSDLGDIWAEWAEWAKWYSAHRQNGPNLGENGAIEFEVVLHGRGLKRGDF